MKKSRGAGSDIRNTLLTGFPTDPAPANGLGDDHASPGTQNSPLHAILKDQKLTLLDLALFLLFFTDVLQVSVYRASNLFPFPYKTQTPAHSN